MGRERNYFNKINPNVIKSILDIYNTYYTIDPRTSQAMQSETAINKFGMQQGTVLSGLVENDIFEQLRNSAAPKEIKLTLDAIQIHNGLKSKFRADPKKTFSPQELGKMVASGTWAMTLEGSADLKKQHKDATNQLVINSAKNALEKIADISILLEIIKQVNEAMPEKDKLKNGKKTSNELERRKINPENLNAALDGMRTVMEDLAPAFKKTAEETIKRESPPIKRTTSSNSVVDRLLKRNLTQEVSSSTQKTQNEIYEERKSLFKGRGAKQFIPKGKTPLSSAESSPRRASAYESDSETLSTESSESKAKPKLKAAATDDLLEFLKDNSPIKSNLEAKEPNEQLFKTIHSAMTLKEYKNPSGFTPEQIRQNAQNVTTALSTQPDLVAEFNGLRSIEERLNFLEKPIDILGTPKEEISVKEQRQTIAPRTKPIQIKAENIEPEAKQEIKKSSNTIIENLRTKNDFNKKHKDDVFEAKLDKNSSSIRITGKYDGKILVGKDGKPLSKEAAKELLNTLQKEFGDKQLGLREHTRRDGSKDYTIRTAQNAEEADRWANKAKPKGTDNDKGGHSR